MKGVRAGGRRRKGEPAWADWPDERLLDLRLCDLDVRIEGSELEERIDRLREELDALGFAFRPHFWLSTHWFTPDGTPGIAVPFYLSHPRLKALERKQMLEVEGGTESWCMRILRHEVGHTLDNVYRLHFRRRYREVFGSWSVPYPEFYRPKPYSKSYVIHLDMWYAQAHPAEDFAETFAVWLRPSSRWRSRYRGWPALRKLEYMDELMREVAPVKPPSLSRKHYFALRDAKRTLREYYEEKRSRYGKSRPDFYDGDLRKLFSDDPEYKGNASAARFLSEIRPDLRRLVARWTGEYQYTIDQVLDDIVKRSRELRLRLVRSPRKSKLDIVVMVTTQTMNYLASGRHRIAM
jgi:hypothetical protein